MGLTPEQVERARAFRDARKIAAPIISSSTEDAETLLACSLLFDQWKENMDYTEGTVLRYADKLYRVRQAILSLSHQPPNGDGMLAIYTPIQIAKEDEILPWVSGELVYYEEKRIFNNIVYKCIQPGGAGANIWTPDLVPAVWEVV